MLPSVYIDGQAGTTGLRIRDWLACRKDLKIIVIDDAGRKDDRVRREAIAAADVVVLCLPDDAAVTAAAWARASGTRVIDASTAHRVQPGWVYGLPELERGRRREIREAPCVANPGCYASAFALLVRPLVAAGVCSTSSPLSIHALSGYSGGGRALIERWEDSSRQLRSLVYEAPYALGNVHKHIPEMIRHTGLEVEPQFVPAVGPFRCGMRVEIPLHAALLSGRHDALAVAQCLTDRYLEEPFVKVVHIEDPRQLDEHSFDPRACNDTNRIELYVVPHPSGHILLCGILDNLGKGASGVAIQNLNLMLGLEESAGLAR